MGIFSPHLDVMWHEMTLPYPGQGWEETSHFYRTHVSQLIDTSHFDESKQF